MFSSNCSYGYEEVSLDQSSENVAWESRQLIKSFRTISQSDEKCIFIKRNNFIQNNPTDKKVGVSSTPWKMFRQKFKKFRSISQNQKTFSWIKISIKMFLCTCRMQFWISWWIFFDTKTKDFPSESANDQKNIM